jgi:hypothetical protein
MIWESQKHVTSRLLELLFMEFVTVDEHVLLLFILLLQAKRPASSNVSLGLRGKRFSFDP